MLFFLLSASEADTLGPYLFFGLRSVFTNLLLDYTEEYIQDVACRICFYRKSHVFKGC